MRQMPFGRRFFRASEKGGQTGRVLLITGAGLLSFSAVCLARGSEAYMEIQNTTLVLFAASAAMVLAGEGIRFAQRARRTRVGPNTIEPVAVPRTAYRIERILRDSCCAFCGKGGGKTSSHKNIPGEPVGSLGNFGRCLNCGSTVCARCAFVKGKEMGRDALRCPGCGGQVY
jgi:hypothetical protein